MHLFFREARDRCPRPMKHRQRYIPQRQIIVIGAARSGTKLLRDILSTHVDVGRVPYDVNYLWRQGNERVSHDELRPDMLTESLRLRIQQSIWSYHRDQVALVEKTVSNCLRVPFVDAVFPEACFVHLVRDGRDVVESSYREWMAPPDWSYVLRKARMYPLARAPGYALRYLHGVLWRGKRSAAPPVFGPRYLGIDKDLASLQLIEVCARQWAICVQRAQEGLAVLPDDRVITIRYEDMVREPVDVLGKLATFIGVEPSLYEHAGDRIVTDNIGKGARQLDAAQFDRALPRMLRTLREFHYV